MIAHNAGIQGSGIALVKLAEQLTAMRVDVVVIVPRKHGIYHLLEKVKGVKIYVIRQIYNETFPLTSSFIDMVLYIPQLLRKICARPLFRSKLSKIIEIEKPDILHTNTGTIRIGAEVAKQKGIPHVWHVRECQTLGCGFHPFGGEKKVATLFTQSHNHCVAITDSVFQYYKLKRDKDCIIYDGVFSKNTALQVVRMPKKNMFLYIGLLSEKKGVKLLLAAIDKVSDKLQGYEFWFAGEDQMGFTKYVNKFKWCNKIKYLGFRKDVYDLMSMSKALVITTEYEGFGFVTAEAMLNRTLVIGRNTAGTKEQMDNACKKIGYDVTLRFLSVEELSDRLLETISMSEERYFDLTEKAYQAVSNLYTTERNAREIYDYYKLVLNR